MPPPRLCLRRPGSRRTPRPRAIALRVMLAVVQAAVPRIAEGGDESVRAEQVPASGTVLPHRADATEREPGSRQPRRRCRPRPRLICHLNPGSRLAAAPGRDCLPFLADHPPGDRRGLSHQAARDDYADGVPALQRNPHQPSRWQRPARSPGHSAASLTDTNQSATCTYRHMPDGMRWG